MTVERILAGDEQAFRDLVEHYRNYLFHIVYAVLRNRTDAEDITQEAFIQIYKSLPQYQSQGLKSWMSRIAVNKAIDFKRKMQRRKENLTESIEEVAVVKVENNVEQPVLDQEQTEIILRRLAELPSDYREYVHAYYLEEKSYKEIAAERGVAVKTVASKLHRAKKWVQKNWREEDFR